MTLLDLERRSIRDFVASCPWPSHGLVLDYGCGAQPYRDIVTAKGATYVGYDRAGLPVNRAGNIGPDEPLAPFKKYAAVLCNQVIQFVPDPYRMLRDLRDATHGGYGLLCLTGPTNWPEINDEDLHRHTVAGAVRLATAAGWTVERAERRAHVAADGYDFSLGYGILGRA